MADQAEAIEDAEIVDAEVDEVRNLPAVRASEAIIARDELTVDEVVAQKDKIEQVMQRVMRDGVHYGLIPGVNKPSLLKPGAEAINVALRLAPHYQSEKIWQDEHLTVVAKCELHHIPTGLVVGTGEGLCTTRESRYAFRQGKRVCPDCGADAIVRSTKKNSYFCISAEGGCGHKFSFGSEKAKALDEQDVSRVPNPDIADQYNTVLKMADKRALIAAVLNATAASDVFTQDAEDMKGGTGSGRPEPEAEAKPKPKPRSKPKEFDPAKDLLPNAVGGAGAEAVDELQGYMRALNERVDWKAVVGAYTKATYDAASARDLDQKQRDEWWIRLRNAVAKLAEVAHPELGASQEEVREAFGWAFAGAVVEEIPLLPETPVDDSVPFSE